ncbi:MAG: hypothetical protein IIB05_03995 [Bacteroidetes bacterium]|nr:hypothetical protein [Bacteroidota bacterium]
MKRVLLILVFLGLLVPDFYGQPVPARDENIPYLMTFGGGGKRETSWGDDDFSQTFFFVIPEEFTDPVYIRVFDPDIGGEIDEINGYWDTEIEYSIYGGKGAYSDPDARETQPTGNYRSGTLLAAKTFGEDAYFDNNWYTFGPFNPSEGEYTEKYQGHIFKIITEGKGGDDGNLYRYFLSTSFDENIDVEGANAFTYEYSFRMWNTVDNISHIYPFIDEECISVKQENFDWDNDGVIRVVSVARKGQLVKVSGEDEFVESEFNIFEEEVGKSLDFQFIKQRTPFVVINNNVVISVRNQYGELMPFFTIPIGGVPKYKYNIKVRKIGQ